MRKINSKDFYLTALPALHLHPSLSSSVSAAPFLPPHSPRLIWCFHESLPRQLFFIPGALSEQSGVVSWPYLAFSTLKRPHRPTSMLFSLDVSTQITTGTSAQHTEWSTFPKSAPSHYFLSQLTAFLSYQSVHLLSFLFNPFQWTFFLLTEPDSLSISPICPILSPSSLT